MSKSPTTELRRAISRPAWLANRAGNALRRPAFIGAISVGTFVTALVSLVVVPRQRQPPVAALTRVRPDTMTIEVNLATTSLRLHQADSSLVAARAELAAAAASQPAADTTAPPGVRRDSLEARVHRLDAFLARAEQAPLLSSYKALAEMPELRDDPRVHALLDSLSLVEREREGFGAVGGVDPTFVALTSRASEVGRAIQTIGEERRSALWTELVGPRAAPTIAGATDADTTTRVAERDSLRLALDATSADLLRQRQAARQMDDAEDRAREQATAVAPPLALLASAFVLSAVIGFAVAFIGELRRPRVWNAIELERYLGVRILSTVETQMPSVERGRREADRAAPPYFDPSAEGYQLAYLGLATDHPTVLMATITGDDPAIAAVVACNLAAVGAHEARNALVIDLEPSCMASAALQSRAEPGLVDILASNATWRDATVAARVGRDRTVDLVPHGVATSPPSAEQIRTLLRQDGSRLARHYDAVFFLAGLDDVVAGLPSALLLPEVAVCAQPGITPLRALRDQLDGIRTAGGSVRGVILWNAERPLLPTPRELAAKPKRARRHALIPATAATPA